MFDLTGKNALFTGYWKIAAGKAPPCMTRNSSRNLACGQAGALGDAPAAVECRA